MLDCIFISVLNMSIVSIYAILFVLITRLLLKKTPKIFSYALWAVVLVRLLCPFSFESVVGLLPNTEAIPQDIIYQAIPQINTGINIVDNSVNTILPPVITPEASVNPIQIWIFIASNIWLMGIAVMMIYSVVSLIKLKRRLVGATPLEKNIYIADHIDSPFVIGLIRPKIYLPSNLSEIEREFIIKHEQTHIKRLDHITRILAFIALAIHWFNPLVWIAFVLSSKDMESSCDEAVMRKMKTDIRAEYSQSLLKFATGRKLMTATPLAFGEGDTKERVKNVMKYKKPVVWVSAICLVLVGVVAVSLMSNGKEDVDTNHSLTDVYEEIRNNDILGRPLQIFSNMQIGDTWYIGVLAGNDIVLSTAEKVNGQWEYMGNIIYPNANDGNSVVFAGKENKNGRYDVFLSTNPNLNSITRTFMDGNEITAYAEHGTYISVGDNGTQTFSPSMTIMEMSNDSKHVELLYKDFNDKILTDISTVSSLSTQNSIYMAQNLSESETNDEYSDAPLNDLIPMVMINDKMYIDTGEMSEDTMFENPESSKFDGWITATVNRNERPAKNNESNFGEGFGYKIIDEESVAIYINEEWYHYKLGDGYFSVDGE